MNNKYPQLPKNLTRDIVIDYIVENFPEQYQRENFNHTKTATKFWSYSRLIREYNDLVKFDGMTEGQWLRQHISKV
jgi:hypothetical protein